MFEKYQFDPKIAAALKSSDKAVIVQFLIDRSDAGIGYERRNYLRMTYQDWSVLLPWLSTRSIRRHLFSLATGSWIFAEQLAQDRWDRSIFYAVNIPKYQTATTGKERLTIV